jgi:hypothetical protein
VVLGQPLEELLGVLEIGGVEALGEPAVDRREKLAAKVEGKLWNG